MIRYKGGNAARKGLYWDLSTGQSVRHSMSGILPGNAATTYLRMPTAVMVLGAPIAGLLYVVLLPFAWLATLTGTAARLVVTALYRIAARSLYFGWRPIEAYFAGRKKTRKPD